MQRAIASRLDDFRYRALHAVDEDAQAAAIDQANIFLAELERNGTITTGERLMLGRDWVRAFARDYIRDPRNEDADRWRAFLVEH